MCLIHQRKCVISVVIDDDNDDIDDDDETEFYPFSWTADPRSAAVIDLLPGFNMSHEMFTMIEKRLHLLRSQNLNCGSTTPLMRV